MPFFRIIEVLPDGTQSQRWSGQATLQQATAIYAAAAKIKTEGHIRLERQSSDGWYLVSSNSGRGLRSWES